MATPEDLPAASFLPTPDSPFHRGEQLIQQRLGVRDKIEHLGNRVIRKYMPDQHRDFYRKLPFLLVGHVDSKGWPWASLLCNHEQPGEPFIESPTDQQLILQAAPFPEDPLAQSAQVNHQLGLLGIDLHSRRRNRASTTVEAVSGTAIALRVNQAYGNCPQYIQKRTLHQRTQKKSLVRETFSAFDQEVTRLIRHADTFFVASSADSDDTYTSTSQPVWGADVSHRGGPPGFIAVEDSKCHIPDFPGNNYFNTLGNFVVNPKAGLLFIDFEQGHLLMLTGNVKIHWGPDSGADLEHSERCWTFKLDHGMWLHNALPFLWRRED